MDRPYTIKNYPQGKFMCQRGEITAAEAYNLLRDTIEGADYSFDVMIARAMVGNVGVAIRGDYVRFVPPDYASRARELSLSR
mgnify:CR=1 FL=1